MDRTLSAAPIDGAIYSYQWGIGVAVELWRCMGGVCGVAWRGELCMIMRCF